MADGELTPSLKVRRQGSSRRPTATGWTRCTRDRRPAHPGPARTRCTATARARTRWLMHAGVLMAVRWTHPAQEPDGTPAGKTTIGRTGDTHAWRRPGGRGAAGAGRPVRVHPVRGTHLAGVGRREGPRDPDRRHPARGHRRLRRRRRGPADRAARRRGRDSGPWGHEHGHGGEERPTRPVTGGRPRRAPHPLCCRGAALCRTSTR